MSNLTLYKNDDFRPEVDEMLSDYFQAEMPSPWPAFKAPKAMRTRETPSLWTRYSGRLALAACVTLLVAAYWSLSGLIPAGDAPMGLERVGNPIGHGHDKTKKPATPNLQDGALNLQPEFGVPNPTAK